MNFKPDFVIFDLDTVSLPFEMLKTFVNKKVFNLKGVFFFSTKTILELSVELMLITQILIKFWMFLIVKIL